MLSTQCALLQSQMLPGTQDAEIATTTAEPYQQVWVRDTAHVERICVRFVGKKRTLAAGFLAAGFCRAEHTAYVSLRCPANHLSQEACRRAKRHHLCLALQNDAPEAFQNIVLLDSCPARSSHVDLSRWGQVSRCEVTSKKSEGQPGLMLTFATFLGFAGPFLNSSLSL